MAVLVGGRSAGVAEGVGSTPVGAGVSVGTGGLGLAETLVGEGNRVGADVALGCTVGVGRGVLVARARTTRVLVGVAVTPGSLGAH